MQKKDKMKYLFIIASLIFSINIFAQTPIDFTKLQEMKEVFFNNGQPFTGECFQNYPSGQKGMEGSFKDGKRDGIWNWYYDDGSRKRETNYRWGKMHGLSIIWYKNGQKRSEIVYDMGQNVKQIRWDEEGNFLPPPTFGGQ